MTFDQLFCAQSVSYGLKASAKKPLFTKLAEQVMGFDDIDENVLHVRDIVAATLERERLGSTGVGAGVAIPHARLAGIERVYGAFTRLETPISYEAIDERPVDLVALLIAPIDSDSVHLRALAHVSRLLRRDSMRTRLRAAPNAQSLYICLAEAQQRSAA